MKHILLGMALCGLFSTAHAMQKDVKAVKEEETVLELYDHSNEYGDGMYAKKVSEVVVVPLTPDASPKSQVPKTPEHTPVDSQNNSVQSSRDNSAHPSPATSPKRLITFIEAAQVVSAFAKPKPLHMRAQSAPEVVAAAAACAQGDDKLNESKKVVTFEEGHTVVSIAKGLCMQTEFTTPEVVGAAAAAGAHADDKPSDEPK